jgi:CubicO group peptidase (beta-lactamase class C family)
MLSGQSQQDSKAAAVDAIFAPLAGAKSPGIAVIVREDSRTVFERGYGARGLRDFAKIDARTNFRLASCSKQFTAMAIMLLVHDGKLRYEDRLTDVFPDFPAYGKAISIRNLLNHTSGLPDYEDLMEAAEKRKGGAIWTETRQIQDDEVLDLLKRESGGKFAPGTQWSYSNSGYVVLGLVVAKVSGKPFREFLRERIFAPLEMSGTVAYQRGQNEVAERAYGHSKEGAGWKETDQSATSATLGDGGIYSSLTDLAKWDEALAQHKLLSEKEMQAALTPGQLVGGAQAKWPANSDRPAGMPVSYGFGWFLDPYRGHARMWHYGDTMGFHSYIVRFPGDKLSVIVLCNRTDLDPESLALKTANLFIGSR